uniref:Uncharacterized protein n=1 Tax=Anguilla anguilla TaxID=7936 RepID=A0A0E9XRC2_ANGAN
MNLLLCWCHFIKLNIMVIGLYSCRFFTKQLQVVI